MLCDESLRAMMVVLVARCCSRKHCWCPGPVLPQGTMLRSVTCAKTGDHVDVCGLRCRQKPCEVCDSCTRDCKGQETTFAMVSVTADSQPRKRDREGFCDLSPPQVTAWTESHRREILKIRMLKCRSPQLRASGVGGRGRLSSL